MRLLLSVVLMVLISLPAMAEGYVYSPEGCEFVMTFPEEPTAVRRCHERFTDKCSMMHSYTKVFDMNATVNVFVSCQSAEESFVHEYSEDVMRTTLLARPGVESLEVYDISYDQNENSKTAALLGAGPSPVGNDVMIYIAQMWVGDNSLLTVEGELIGHDVEEADFLFANIMKTLHHKNDSILLSSAEENETAEEAPSAEEAADSETESGENDAEN